MSVAEFCKSGFRAFIRASVACLVVASPSNAAQPKTRIGIVPAQDRWITLSDGSRVYLGRETSYLLGHLLFLDGRFRPILLDLSTADDANAAVGSGRDSQIPTEWTDWLRATPASSAAIQGPSARVDLIVEPVVEDLLYASGSRSNRIVYGFTADHDNPYSNGKSGSLDNEFVPVESQRLSCTRLDYFAGDMTPLKGGFKASNFGADADEGFSFFIFGYGIGYKQKKYEVDAKLRFRVSSPLDQNEVSKVYSVKAKGKDVFIAGSYSGFSLGIEIQRRETLKAALTRLLPSIVASFLADQSSPVWSTVVNSVDGSGQVFIDTGIADGLVKGVRLKSAFGDVYRVEQVLETASRIVKESGPAFPFKHEVLFWDGMAQVSPLVSSSSVIQEANSAVTGFAEVQRAENFVEQKFDLDLGTQKRIVDQKQSVAQLNCFGKKESWLAQTISGLLGIYGRWRYSHVFDQNFNPPKTRFSKSSMNSTKRIGIIDTGVDYNDSDLSDHAARSGFVSSATGQPLGYDFISRDTRPSDDNGHGTAVAKLLHQLSKVPWALTSLKVVGPHGETHSAAIYEAFRFAAQERLDAVIVAWHPVLDSRAYEDGVKFAEQAGVKVFTAPPAEKTLTSIKDFRTTGLGGAQLVLRSSGVQAVQAAVGWLNGTTPQVDKK